MMTHTLECDEDLKAAIIKCSSKLLQTLLEKKKEKLKSEQRKRNRNSGTFQE